MATSSPDDNRPVGSDAPLVGEPDLHRPEVRELLRRYWRVNIRITVLLLAVWAGVGLGCAKTPSENSPATAA